MFKCFGMYPLRLLGFISYFKDVYKLLFIYTILTLAGHHLECVGSGSNGKLSVEVQGLRRKTRGKREHLSFWFPFFLLCFESIQIRFHFKKYFFQIVLSKQFVGTMRNFDWVVFPLWKWWKDSAENYPFYL